MWCFVKIGIFFANKQTYNCYYTTIFVVKKTSNYGFMSETLM